MHIVRIINTVYILRVYNWSKRMLHAVAKWKHRKICVTVPCAVVRETLVSRRRQSHASLSSPLIRLFFSLPPTTELTRAASEAWLDVPTRLTVDDASRRLTLTSVSVWPAALRTRASGRDEHKSDRTLISARHSVRYGWASQHASADLTNAAVTPRWFAAHPRLADNDDETRPRCLRHCPGHVCQQYRWKPIQRLSLSGHPDSERPIPACNSTRQFPGHDRHL